MRLVNASLAAAVAAVLLAIAGCAQPAAAPTPTKAPTAPTAAPQPTKPAEPAKATEPTKAPAPAAPTVAPTAAPAKTASFPEKGKVLSLIVPYPAGGGNDIGARVLGPLLEKELGIPVEIVNKGGAGSQIGMTDLAKAKPDGYTVAYPNWPNIITIYMDPSRNAVFSRDNLQALVGHVVDPFVFAVKADSPYKTMKDVMDAAKAQPEKIRVASTGPLSNEHLALMQLRQMYQASFAMVSFEGGAPGLTALLGGHVEAGLFGTAVVQPHLKSGAVRVVAVMDKEENRFVPGAKTADSQGFKVYAYMTRGFVAPKGVPRDAAAAIESATKKAMETEEHRKKMEELAFTPRFMSAVEFDNLWSQLEAEVAPLVKQALAEKK